MGHRTCLAMLITGALGAQAPFPPFAPPVIPAPVPPALPLPPPTPDPRSYDPPRLAIEPSGLQAFGSVGPRQKTTRTYRIRNISEAPIRLRLLEPVPGVSLAGPALAGPIHPGGESTLDMTTDPLGHVGYQRIAARFGTDDPRQGTYLLPYTQDIRPDLTVDEGRKSFGTVAPGANPRLVYVFRRETGDALELKLASTVPDYLVADIRGTGATAELHLSLRADGLAPGAERGLEHVKLASNAPLQATLDVYADWEFRHPIAAVPPRVVFLDAVVASKVVTLASRDGAPFLIEKAEIQGGGFAVEPPSTQAASSHSLQIRRVADSTGRSLLVVTPKDHPPLRILLAYLPPSPPSRP